MRQRNYRVCSGISLYTMLGAVIVLGVLGVALATKFTSSKSRATALYALVQTVGQSATKFHLDSACYPTSIAILSTYSSTDGLVNCSRTLARNVWDGPYLKDFPLDSDGAALIPDYGPDARLAAIVDDGTPFIQIKGLSNSILDGFIKICPATKCRESKGRILYSYVGTAPSSGKIEDVTAQSFIDFTFIELASAVQKQIDDGADMTDEQMAQQVRAEFRDQGYEVDGEDYAGMVRVHLTNDSFARAWFEDTRGRVAIRTHIADKDMKDAARTIVQQDYAGDRSYGAYMGSQGPAARDIQY